MGMWALDHDCPSQVILGFYVQLAWYVNVFVKYNTTTKLANLN